LKSGTEEMGSLQQVTLNPRHVILNPHRVILNPHRVILNLSEGSTELLHSAQHAPAL